MTITLRKITTWAFGPSAFPIFLLAVCVAAYAPFLPRLGFYWDDYPMNWIATTMGGEGLARYFSTNRPVWGLLYRLTTPVLGSHPLTWQVAALLLRWLSGVALWALLRLAWPGRLALAAWASLLFVVYPSFGQQSIAFLYAHFYVVLILFLLSLIATTQALRKPHRFVPLTLAALAAAAYQMLAMEYFLLLEVLRPLLIWHVLGERGISGRNRLVKTGLHWLPYLVVWVGSIAWRSLLLGFQTYQPTLLSRLRANPGPALFELVRTVLEDIWMILYGAWERAFATAFAPDGDRDTLRFALMAAVFTASIIYLFLARFRPAGQRAWLRQPLLAGGLALFVAGGPFWLTDLEIGLSFPNDRFSLSFLLGASLFTAALLHALPWPRWTGSLLMALALTASVGLQFENGARFQQDWSRQRAFFWQMVWRAPALQPGTTLLTNDLPFHHYTDNSLSAALNWIYDPHNDPARMQYMLYYPTLRRDSEDWLVTLPPNRPITRDYLATTFTGSTSRVITLVFNPPGCLRVLDPEVEAVNWMVPLYLRETLVLSSLTPILAEPGEGQAAPILPPHLFGKEPAPNWCYYFEKADLARQFGDWDTVNALAELAFASGDYPNDPAERLPFIEGYAHSANWQRAVELSAETRAITPAMQPVLCRLWQRIERETADSPARQAALQEIQAANHCTP